MRLAGSPAALPAQYNTIPIPIFPILFGKGPSVERSTPSAFSAAEGALSFGAGDCRSRPRRITPPPEPPLPRGNARFLDVLCRDVPP